MGNPKLDILAIAAHPDDAELACSGTLVKHQKAGKKIGILDLTHGELGSRGTAETRLEEAAAASKIMKLEARERLNLGDGFFEINEESLKQIIVQIRRFQPEIVLCNAPKDRHPDHGRASELASRACFLAGLVKIETEWDGKTQDKWRPKTVYHYGQDHYLKPDLVVDISSEFDTKMEAIKAFKTQFYNPNSKEPNTPISGKDFLDFIEARAASFGREIGVKYGEGFITERPVGTNDLFGLV